MTAADYKAPVGLLEGRVILVTGAGDGIGRVAAKCYASFGATIILAGRTIEKLESVYDEIVQAGHPEPAIYPIDLSSATFEHYKEMAEQIDENFERLDGLLHNAGLLGQRSSIASTKPDIWLEVMQVNVNAQFMMTKALLPLLNASADASIVFTSSGVGRKGRAYWGPYSVSKFATEGFMQVLADEVEATSNIRVNSLNPGATNTAMRRMAYPGEHPDTNPTPEEIMPAYLYLMGPDSKGVHGQALDAQ